jgi:hypothetical protein
MLDFHLDMVADLVVVLGMTLGALVFTGLGVLGEQAGFSNLIAGQAALGAWELFFGAWALFVGVYLIGIKQVLPRATILVSG